MLCVRTLVALMLLAVVGVPQAQAKGVSSIDVVGADGRSVSIEPEHAVLAVMLYHPASVFDIRPRLTQPRGGWVRSYPLGPGGFPAMPGRFYPATGALCFSWNQLSEPANCARLGTPHRLLAVANRARLFHGRSTAITSVRGARDVNLVAAIQLAFDRYRARRTSHPPAKCLSFTIVWSGPKASRHPSRICISRHGVHARGVLYRGNPALWRLALANH